MRARVFLEDNFFSAFNNHQTSQNILESDTKTENKNRLIDVLKTSEIHLAISEREVIKILNQKDFKNKLNGLSKPAIDSWLVNNNISNELFKNSLL